MNTEVLLHEHSPANAQLAAKLVVCTSKKRTTLTLQRVQYPAPPVPVSVRYVIAAAFSVARTVQQQYDLPFRYVSSISGNFHRRRFSTFKF